jgi:nucleotide-binding universal stress UspA family protein
VAAASYAFQTILCAVDFSEHSGHALRYASVLATRFGARLLVLNIADPLLVAAARASRTDLVGETRTDLRNFVDRVLADAGSPAPDTEVIVESGEPPKEILEVASREQADVIVMGSLGLTGYRKYIYGSTTSQLLGLTHVPVLVVPMAEKRIEN